MRVPLAVALTLALAGCGGSTESAAPVVQAQAPAGPVATLHQTQWQLFGVHQAGVTVRTRPNLDVVLVLERDGRFLLRACNNVFGDAVVGERTAMFDGGTTTHRICPGAAAEVDAAVRSALFGEVAWEIDDRRLSLSTLDNDVRLDFRVRDPAQPPVSAVLVADIPGTARGCRIMAGAAESGERLYALARTRPDGPWRLVRGGPAAPGDTPLLASEQHDSATGNQCTAGFAPEGSARVAYQASPTAPVVDLDLHRVPGLTRPIYTGLLDSPDAAEPGRIRAYDAAGRVLAVWATLA